MLSCVASCSSYCIDCISYYACCASYLGGNLYHWDWLQLLIIPAVLAVGGYIINLTISRGEQEATKRIYSGTQVMLPVLRISQ